MKDVMFFLVTLQPNKVALTFTECNCLCWGSFTSAFIKGKFSTNISSFQWNCSDPVYVTVYVFILVYITVLFLFFYSLFIITVHLPTTFLYFIPSVGE